MCRYFVVAANLKMTCVVHNLTRRMSKVAEIFKGLKIQGFLFRRKKKKKYAHLKRSTL